MVYTNQSKDITLIEIKRNDSINLEYFLEVDQNLNNNENYASYIEMPVYILRFEKGKEQRYSEGVILEIEGSGIISFFIHAQQIRAPQEVLLLIHQILR